MMNRQPFLRLNIGGKLHAWDRPVVMGILNLTPDSFYQGSRSDGSASLDLQAGELLSAGADILDLGGYSTRPGAEEVPTEEEIRRIVPAVRRLREHFPDAILSVDTFRSEVARLCVEAGADIINDISGGTFDEAMYETVAELKVPYVLMHTRGTPATMQTMTGYTDVVGEVLTDLAFKADRLHQLGVCDVIVDPGFGFAKTREQNFRLLDSLRVFTEIGPVLVGVSRKSMITRTLDISADEALNGTTALNTIALMNGASILRVHDAKEAVQAVKLFDACRETSPESRQVITTTFSDNSSSTVII